MNTPFPYYPKVETTIKESETHFDINILSFVRKKVNNEYIDCTVLKALRFTNKIESEMSKFDKIKRITEFINQFHLDVAILLATNKFDVNDKKEVIIDNEKSYFIPFSISGFQMPQSKYVKSLKTK